MFLIWKQSMTFSMLSFESLLKFLELFSACRAVFLTIINGRPLPKTLYISSTPIARTSQSSITVMVYLLKLPFLKLAYYSKESPLLISPILIP